jgi:extracellular factor (EF) 3-hydroxypalmitic acid methyl ester biosynthesis protein
MITQAPAYSSTDALNEMLTRLAAEQDLDRLTRLVPAVCATMKAVRDARPKEWGTDVLPWIRSTESFARFQQDPFTNHSFRRPRGYAGDAGLLDQIYRPDTIASRDVTETGRAIFRYTSVAAGPRAVANRRALIARKVDSLAFRSGAPLRVASLACGHLREAELMASVETRRVERYWAIDQDPCSVAHVAECFRGGPIEPLEGSVKDLIRGGLKQVDELDFFYAAGLFDYLDEKVSKRLVRRMFERLRPGGILWVANFVPSVPDRAYMEAMMDWWLVYRSPEEVESLDAEIDPAEIAGKRVFLEAEENIVFLELQRGTI